MKKLIAASVALAFVSLSASPLFAQDETPTQLYRFEDKDIEGKRIHSEHTLIEVDRGAKFEHLHDLPKRVFSHKIKASVSNL